MQGCRCRGVHDDHDHVFKANLQSLAWPNQKSWGLVQPHVFKI